MIEPDTKEQMPMIFLVGPPGAGKSSLGKKVCEKLELSFADLSTPQINIQPIPSQKESLTEVIDKRSADVIALPWSLQQDKETRKLTRCSGVLLLLWAHPLDMQARSGHSESLFTPSPRIKTKGGFGRNGTGCLEFRSLDRAVDEVLILVGSSFDEAIKDLKEYIVSIREESLEPPIIQAGLNSWADEWKHSYGINKKTSNIILDAMARYILYLRAEGKSPRTLSGVYSDLDSAGMLVLAYDYPTGKKAAKVLDFFSSPPWTIEFKRKFSDSPNAIKRYERNLEGFARFLKYNLP